MISESIFGLKRLGTNHVIHYVADTGALLRGPNPTVVTVHGVASRWVEGTRSGSKEKLWRTRVSRAVASSDSVITVSNSSANDICEIFNIEREKVAVIPHGIDAQKFATPCTYTPELLARSLPNQFVLYLGNIEPRKNLVNLIKAFQLPALRNSGVCLLIAGRPAWDYREVMGLIESSTNVDHLGFVSDTDRIALMQACDLFVFPSLYEGFGFPVVEALAAGAVVASTRRGSLREVAGPALLLEGTSAEELCRDILNSLSDDALRTACKSEGYKWAKGFSWEKSISRHLDVYENVLQK
ncbi:glycosyltransferase family 4 protein [Arthrobacter psychrochitiniphilus]|uniref:glycosyltransferase family 4 protein n=1 Tax=Arthrobacter psychrochitiniphilus TaxID=291045 RepID=UPI003F7C0952